MKRKKLILSITALTAAFAAAAGIEWDGYHAFDTRSGGNLLCTLDRTCRPLTKGEVEIARSVFGNALDYTRVKIFNRRYFYVAGSKQCTLSPNGNVYLPEGEAGSVVPDFSLPDGDRKHFIHELTHVWQYQSGVNIQREAIEEFFRNSFRYSATYEYDVEADLKFKKFNLEQQANMVGDYYETRQGLYDLLGQGASRSEVDAACLKLRPFEKKLSPLLPIAPVEACAGVQAQKPGKRHHKAPPPEPSLPALDQIDFCGS